MWIRSNLATSLVLMCYSNQHILEINHKHAVLYALQPYHRVHVQGFAMFSQNELFSVCQYYFCAYETCSNVQPLYNHVGLKFTNTLQVAAHIVSEQKQKPSGSLTVGNCNFRGHRRCPASWGGTEDPVVSTSWAVKNGSLIYTVLVQYNYILYLNVCIYIYM